MSKELRAAALPIVDPANYRILGEFAKGGFGRLLRAHDRRLNREVALKELFQDTEEAVERFVREALITARLEHPSIVPVHEVGRWPTGALFYAMKLVSGRGLDVLIAEATTLRQRLALVPHVLALSEAIAYAHSERIIHRDLKPANVLVGAFGETVVIDWGLAKDLRDEDPTSGLSTDVERAEVRPGSSANLTMAGAVLGTPSYMSPEQALSRAVDERTDVYALGAILYHVLAGAVPHEGATAYEVLIKIHTEAPLDLAARQPGMPPELAAIVKKAMARAPEDRYPTALELSRDLRAFQTGQIVGAHKYSLPARVRRLVRRYRAVLAVVMVALVVLAAGAVLFVQRIRKERDIARQERDRAEQGKIAVEAARREADDRADELTLLQARGARDVDPNATLAWLKKLSPAFARWGAARILAEDARARGIARVLSGHTGTLNDADLSPDGRTVAFASDDRRVSLWDLATDRVRYLSGHTDEVWSVTFAADGQRLASGSRDGTVRVWDVATGAARVLAPDRGPIWQSSFLPGGAHLLSFNQRGAVFVWDLATGAGKEIEPAAESVGLPVPPRSAFVPWTARGELVLWDPARGEARRFPGQTTRAKLVAASPDDARVATADRTGHVRLWSVKDGALRTLPGPTGEVNTLVFSPDSQQIVAGGEGGAAWIWDAATGKGRALRGHEASLLVARFSPRGDKLATGADDRVVRLWDLESGESRSFRGFAEPVSALVFSADGGELVATSRDHTARAWDLSQMEGEVIARHDGGAAALAFFRDGRCVASGGEDGVIRVASIALERGRGEACGRLGDKPAHEGPIRALATWPSGGRIASAGRDGAVRVDDVDGGEPIVLRGHSGSVSALVISSDGKLLASGGSDGTVRVWDLERREGRVVARHEGGVAALASSPSGGMIASAGADRRVRLWDAATDATREIQLADKASPALTFSPDGRLLEAGDLQHNVYLWSVAGADVRRFVEPRAITSFAFLPGGDAAVIAQQQDVIVLIIDLATGAARRVLRDQPAQVMDLQRSPDGLRVATAYKDGAARIWDLETGESRVLAGHTKAVVRVAFSPDGRRVVTASADGTVRLFRDDLPLEPAALRAWLEDQLKGP